MTLVNPIISFVFKFSAALAALLAVLELLKRSNTRASLVLAAIYIFISAILLRIYFLGIAAEIPYLWLVAYHATFSLLTGPMLILQLNRMLDFEVAAPTLSPWHFLPALAAFVADTLLCTLTDASLRTFLDQRVLFPDYTAFKAAVLILFLHFSAYYLILLYRVLRAKKMYSIHSFPSLFATLLIPFAGTIFAVAGFQENRQSLLSLGGILLGSTVILIMVFSARNPGFLETLKKNMERQKYEKTRLENLDIGQVSAKLEDLFKTGKLYLNENLTLDQLAEELVISRHQLSRILNENYGKSFRDFVNEFRVNEAKRLLEIDNESTVMRIGFEAGFNNKATFNAQFLRLTGMTPVAYRKIHGRQ